MKVVCKENTSKNLNLNEIRSVYRHIQYPVRIGNEYIVMGLMIPKDVNCLYYLVSDSDSLPYWMPYGLFDISDNVLSPNWFIRIFDKADSLINFFYLSGFDELCNNEDYNDDLMEGEISALDIYFKRKAEVEEWYEDRALLDWVKKQY